MLTAKPGNVHHKAILSTINQLYRSAMSESELYEATRGVWKVGKRKENAEFAMAVYQGIVREVYRIDQWYKAGTLIYQTRDAQDLKRTGWWEFSGRIAEDIREEYVGYFVCRSSQNPFRYVNV